MKLLVSIVLFFATNFLFAQGIEINRLHSETGKSWKIDQGPDDAAVDENYVYDTYIFFTDGKLSIGEDSKGLKVRNNWTFDPKTNLLEWIINLDNGKTVKFKAEIIDLFEKRMVTNLAINNGDPKIVVFASQY